MKQDPRDLSGNFCQVSILQTVILLYPIIKQININSAKVDAELTEIMLFVLRSKEILD